MSGQIMTPEHPRWSEFVFKLNEESVCLGSTTYARAILRGMSEIDIESSLSALKILGGTCDCEILFRVARVTEDAAAS